MPGRLKKFGWGAFTTLLLVPLAALAVAVFLGAVRLPPELTPWGRIELERPPGPFTRLQLNSLAQSDSECFVALSQSNLEYRRIADRPLKNGCGLPNGVSVRQSHVPYSSGFSLSCPMAAALYIYEREIQEIARTTLGSDLARIHHLGTYSCRNINGSSRGRRSQHATANAIDISGFTLADGRKITLVGDWGDDTQAGRFLEQVRDAGCDYFNTVLGPEYNALHRNHFHMDMGRARICR